MKNKLKCGLRQHDLKLVDLIKLWFSLIKQVKSLILELINFGDLIKNIVLIILVKLYSSSRLGYLWIYKVD